MFLSSSDVEDHKRLKDIGNLELLMVPLGGCGLLRGAAFAI